MAGAARDGERDTVAAIATARGRAGIGVIRVSGHGTRCVARAIVGSVPAPRAAALRTFRAADGSAIDRGFALFFPAPASYTGEDVLELHAHGGEAVLRMLLDRCLEAGARLAEPGEFTRRAFLEGRLDLAQAEAVADLIEAGTREAARAAQATLAGEFSRRVRALVTGLTALRAILEASLDFADEDVGEPDGARVAAELADLDGALAATLAAAERGSRLRDGVRAVLVGAPNVGKSSVLNRLAGDERAIVTPVPGTTRDVVRDTVVLDGVAVEIADTAGLRDSDDPVERAGMARTREQVRHADLVLLVVDDREPAMAAPEVHGDGERMTVRNKIDLSGAPPGPCDGGLRVSALTGAGFDALASAIAAHGAAAVGEGGFSARRRHVEALREARVALADAAARHREGAGVELVAEELRRAQRSLGRITGEVHSDDLLGEIFATFCIGK